MDRFFASDFNVQILLQWIEEIRQNLFALNQLTPTNSNDINSQIIFNIVENNRLKTLDYYLLSKKEIEIQNNLVNKSIVKNELIAAAIITQNVLNQTLNDKIIEADRTIIQEKYEELTRREEFEEKARTQSHDRNAQTGFSETYISETGEVSSPRFPVPGEVYNNHMTEISDFMSNKEKFDVFTGASDPSNPSLTFFKSWTKMNKDGKMEVDSSKTFTPNKPYSDYINELIKNSENNIPIGTYKFFIEKLHGRYSTGAPYKKNKVESTKNKNMIPTELTNRMVFAAYINNYNDNFSINKNDYNFIGRGEGFPVYKDTKRTLTLEFSILADFSAEMMVAMSEFYRTSQKITPNNIDEQLEQIVKNFPDWGLGILPNPQVFNDGRVGSHIPGMYSDTPESLWHKITFLAQCAYPYYRSDGKLKEQPFVRIRIADFYDITGMITSLSWDLNELEGIQIDLNPSNIGNIPLAIKGTMNVDIYHDFEPNSNYYGFYHRKEFDEGTIDPVTGDGSLGTAKQRMDTILENVQKNSPAHITNLIKNEGLLGTPSILNENLPQLKQEVYSLRESLDDLKNAGMKIADALLSSRSRKAMQAFARIQKIVNVIRIQEGLPPIEENAKLGVESFGYTQPIVQKGNNLPKSIKDQLKDTSNFLNNKFTAFDESYTSLMNLGQESLTKASESLQFNNSSSKELGLSLIENKELQNQSTEVNKLKSSTPKSIKDIIDSINSKQVNQNK